MTSLLRFFASVGFGGSVGAALGALLYAALPSGAAQQIDPSAMIWGGTGIGILLHHFVERITAGMLTPTAIFYGKLVNLLLVGRFLSPETRVRLFEALTEHYVLGEGQFRSDRQLNKGNPDS